MSINDLYNADDEINNDNELKEIENYCNNFKEDDEFDRMMNNPQEEDLEAQLLAELEKEKLPRIKVTEPDNYLTYSDNFNKPDKMFSMYALKREIFNFMYRVDYGRMTDPDSNQTIIDALQERYDYIEAGFEDGRYTTETYQDCLKAQLQREEAIVSKAKKQHDRERAQKRKEYILMEIDDNKEDYIEAYKELCKTAPLIEEKKEELSEQELSKQELSKNEPEEYVTFTAKYHDTTKMFCVSAIQEEIEIFGNREDFGRLVDPDNTEYILSDLKERLTEVKAKLDSGEWPPKYYLECLEMQSKREEQIMKIAKKTHDKDRSEQRLCNIKMEINKLSKEVSSMVDLAMVKGEIQSAVLKQKMDLISTFKSFTQDEFDKLVNVLLGLNYDGTKVKATFSSLKNQGITDSALFIKFLGLDKETVNTLEQVKSIRAQSKAMVNENEGLKNSLNPAYLKLVDNLELLMHYHKECDVSKMQPIQTFMVNMEKIKEKIDNVSTQAECDKISAVLDKLQIFDSEMVSGYKEKEYKLKIIELINQLKESKKKLKASIEEIPSEVSKEDKKGVVSFINQIKAMSAKIDKDLVFLKDMKNSHRALPVMKTYYLSMEKSITNKDIKKDEIEVNLLLNTSKASSFFFKVSIEANKIDIQPKDSSSFKTHTSLINISAKARDKVPKDGYTRLSVGELTWDYTYKIGLESPSKLKSTLLSRRGSYVKIQLMESHLFGSECKGVVNIALDSLGNCCSIYDEAKVTRDTGTSDYSILYLIRINSGLINTDTSKITTEVEALSFIPPLFYDENFNIIYVKKIKVEKDNNPVDTNQSMANTEGGEDKKKNATKTKAKPKATKGATQGAKTEKSNPPMKKLNYDDVLSEYSKVISADILKDPYHSSLIYCKSYLMDAEQNMQKTIDKIEDDYDTFKYLNDKLDFIKKFNMFVDYKFQQGTLTIEEYKTNVQSAKKLNAIVLQFYTHLDDKHNIEMLTKRMQLIDKELTQL